MVVVTEVDIVVDIVVDIAVVVTERAATHIVQVAIKASVAAVAGLGSTLAPGIQVIIVTRMARIMTKTVPMSSTGAK